MNSITITQYIGWLGITTIVNFNKPTITFVALYEKIWRPLA